MPKQPFHHGNLRDELLERAEAMLRERGNSKPSSWLTPKLTPLPTQISINFIRNC